MKKSAAIIKEKFKPENILIKGGHLKNKASFDVLLSQNKYYKFKSIKTDFRIHGTGSYLNALISAFVFKGEPLRSCIEKSKASLRNSIKRINSKNPILNV